ncbi:hypothetical protein ACG7TL_005425 [Trametes sanguinea]
MIWCLNDHVHALELSAYTFKLEVADSVDGGLNNAEPSVTLTLTAVTKMNTSEQEQADTFDEDTLPPSSPDVALSELLSLPGLYTLPSPSVTQASSSPLLGGIFEDNPPSELSIIASSPVRTQGVETAEEDEQKAIEVYKQVLGYLADHGRTFGDLVLHVSKGENHMGKERYWGFFSVEGRVEEVLSAWASSQNSATGRKCVHQWAVVYVQQRVQSEGDYATRSKLLHTSSMDLDADFAKDFSMPALHSRIRELCPTMLSILNAFSTTAKQTNTMKPSTRVWKDNCVAAQALIALGARSQQNSYAHHILGLYAYASGAQRQVISVMSQLGLTISYPMLAGRDKSRTEDASTVPEDTTVTAIQDAPATSLGNGVIATTARTRNVEEDAGQGVGDSDDEYWQMLSDDEDEGAEELACGPIPKQAAPATEMQIAGVNTADGDKGDAGGQKTRQSQGLGSAAVGLLKRLSNACRSRSREAALMNLLAYVYDNINMLFKVAEQVVGRKDTQQNGTCATTFKLYDASLADMQMSDLLASLVDAPPLSVNDILLLATENAALTDCLTHTVLRIIVTYGGERFARFQDEVAASLPNTPDKIPVHKTEIFPLPAMHIDESSTTGNADVLGEIFSVMMYSQLSWNRLLLHCSYL